MFKNIEEIANHFEILKFEEETKEEFEKRVLMTYLTKEGGDPFHVTEIITGKDYHKFDKKENGLSFVLHQIKGKYEKEKSIKNLDTYLKMPWEYYQEILKHNDFEKVYEEYFKENGEEKETYQIWVQDKNGIFLTAESYTYTQGEKIVNSTTAYFEVDFKKRYEDFNEIDNQFHMKAMSETSNGQIPEKIVGDKSDMRTVSYDGRVGLIRKIKDFENSPFSFNNPWKAHDNHFLWLKNYSEKKGDYEEISEEKLKKLPRKVREMVGYK